ncbi:MAG: molecular chaperone DnaJ, partial [Flavobacteriales bacterium]|nr:molecular chaperone DnaJ [Flavobacteriales bacterium]
MIPSPKELKELARAKEGSLRDVPFAVLLLALESQGRTAVLEIRRNQLHKKILLEEGTPVDCRSNLLHETLGKFLVHKGKLSEENYQKVLAESASSGALFGDVLMRLELLTAFSISSGSCSRT